MKKYLISVFIFAMTVGLVAQPIFVLSEDVGGNKEEIDQLNTKISAKKQKIDQLEKSIKDYKDKIKQKRLESISLANQMSILDNRIIQVELDIEATGEKLSSLNLEIEALELSIEDKEIVIDKQQDMIAELVRSIHQQDDKNYIEIAAAYDNFSEFYNQLQYIQTVEKDLGKNLKALKNVRSELEEKKQQTEERKLSYEELNEELTEKRKNLEEQTFSKQNLLAQTQSSELKFKTLLTSLRNQYQEIENEITAIEQEVRKKLENKISQTPEDQNGLLSWPTQSRYVTSYFHDPDYPYRHVFEHSGIDIRAAQGTPLKAVASGYVARAKKCYASTCYSYVMLVHSSGISTVYGHMTNILVSEDKFVARGDIIGYSGGTPGTVGAGPFVTGPHLHFEVRKNGIPVNPLSYLVRDW